MTSPFRRAAEEKGRTDLASFWAGQSAPLARLGPAAEIFASFAGAYD
jgi:hypothetical protein